MTERRYREDEVAAIFADAAESQELAPRPAGAGTGMTLPELQEIGREVGISAEAIARAAGQLDRPAQQASRQFLGLPIGVGRTVELGRYLSDAEWDRLVVDLRETFDARGRVSGHGSLRQWTNGNLQALLEPGASGHRLRLRTLNGNARGFLLGGVGTLGVGAVTYLAAMLGGGTIGGLDMVGSFGIIGAGLMAMGAVRLPSWAKTRQRQMEDVIARLVARTSPPQPGEGMQE